jgi:dolichol-phosphate mannosyltransferase
MLPYDKSVVIIPTYNESDNVERMINTLQALSPDLSILIIEDNSPDGTAAIVKKLQQKSGKIFMVERKGKLGLGTAYIEGFKWSLKRGYDFIFEMDCDFSHDPQEIPKLLEAAQTNDLVIGSRYIQGIRIINWPIHRLLLSYGASLYTRIITGMPVFDATGGFKCFRRKTLEALNLDKVFLMAILFQIELNFKVFSKGFKIKEVPIIFYERRDGQSKMNKSIVHEAIFAVFKLRLKRIFGTL